jgi:hypothetical protein
MNAAVTGIAAEPLARLPVTLAEAQRVVVSAET